MLKRPLPLIIGLVALVLLGLMLRQCRSSSGQNFQTVAVTRGPITQAVTATGTLNPVQNVQVGSQVSGNIQKLFADFNSIVKAGQVIAQIDPVVFQANVNQAEGDLANAQAALELARLNAARTQALVAKQNSAQSDLDQVMANLHQAEANVKIKEGALEKAKADLDHCTITSPIDGIVISRNVDVGQTVAASLQAPVIFTIANDLAKMQIDANVAEADVGGVAVDQDVDFTVDAFPYAHLPRQGRSGAQRADHGAKRGDVRHRHRREQSGFEIETRNDGERFHRLGASRRCVEDPERRASFSHARTKTRRRRRSAIHPPLAAGRPRGKPPARGERRIERSVYVLAPGASKPARVTIKTGISDGVATEILKD